MLKQSIKLIFIVIAVVLMFGVVRNVFAQTDNRQLTEAVKDSAFLVDVRTAAEFSAGSAKGAVNIPLDKIEEQLYKFKDKKNIVVFCRSGNRSARAKNILEKSGFKNVINGGTWKNVNQIVNSKQNND